LCPCGCENRFDENCVYDTPLQRHVKNIINVLDDEQWVIDGMKAAQQSVQADEFVCRACEISSVRVRKPYPTPAKPLTQTR